MDQFSLEALVYSVFAIVLSFVVLLGNITKKLDITNDEGTLNLKALFYTGGLYILSGLIGFILCFNSFYTPALSEYQDYKFVVSTIFGGFGTLTIPAIHNMVELAIEKALKNVKKWAGEENTSELEQKVKELEQRVKELEESQNAS